LMPISLDDLHITAVEPAIELARPTQLVVLRGVCFQQKTVPPRQTWRPPEPMLDSSGVGQTTVASYVGSIGELDSFLRPPQERSQCLRASQIGLPGDEGPWPFARSPCRWCRAPA